MSLLIGFLTFILIVNCLFLILLILIQLPKKEAGAGIAFGGAATDALFGAGSGNALTKMTKYSASIFVGLAVVLSVMNARHAREGSRRLEQELSRQASSTPSSPLLPSNPTRLPVPQTNPTTASSNGLSTNLLISTVTNQVVAPAASATNPATNPAPVPAK
jgi:protein translocase SecG subunit